MSLLVEELVQMNSWLPSDGLKEPFFVFWAGSFSLLVSRVYGFDFALQESGSDFLLVSSLIS